MNVYLGDPLMTSATRVTTGADLDGDGYGNLCDADFDDDGRVTGDLDALGGTIAPHAYDPHLDLDGDRDVDIDDATIASLFLFLPPGPRATD